MDSPTTSPLPEVATNPLPSPPAKIPTKPADHSRIKPLLVVLIITLLVAVPAYLYSRQTKKDEVATEPLTVPAAAQAFFLTIDSPAESVYAVNGEVLIKGTTTPGATVAVVTDVDDVIIEADSEGTFEDSVVVGEHGGAVRITAYAENGEEKSETYEIASPEQAAAKPVLGVQDTAVLVAKNTNALNDRTKPVKATNKEKEPQNVSLDMEDRVDPVKVKPTPTPSPKTTVDETQKKVSTFLKTKKAETAVKKIGKEALIELLTEEGTASAKAKKDKSKLGSMLASPSATPKANVARKLVKMAAKEATPGAVLKRHAVSGVITSLSGGVVTIAHQIQRERGTTIYYNTATAFKIKGLENPTGADLKVGMHITAAGTPLEGKLLATRIHVIPGKALGIAPVSPVATQSSEASNSATPSATPSTSPTPTPSPTPTATAAATPIATTSATPRPD